MIYTKRVKTALRLAYQVHRDQLDKGNVPYIFHPFSVAMEMDTEDEICTALLHDAVEDAKLPPDHPSSCVSWSKLENIFSESVIEALRLLTRQPEQGYMDYIRCIKANPLATKVKLADLRHNRNSSRLDEFDEKAKKLFKKYDKAIKLLMF